MEYCFVAEKICKQYKHFKSFKLDAPCISQKVQSMDL